MKSKFIKITFSFCIVVFLSACHTFEHHNIFLENIKRNLNQKLLNSDNENTKINSDNENTKINSNKTKNIEMAPIDLPKQKEKVQKLTLQKRVKNPNINGFDLTHFKNWNELKLIKKFGKSDFVKEEGKLKNYQYHLKECFLDIFLIKKDNGYFVNYVETRPTKLNGKINIQACHKNVYKTLK